jgi:tRNA-Thr(GGU) m(6)t(6)A37 methyltransferase TsaA
MRVGVCHKEARAMNITLTSIGHVPTIRADPTDDNWDNETTRIDLDTTRFTADALLSLDSFSQVEVLYWFHHAEAAISTLGAHHPRDNTAWPLAGIFAQRGKNRPNRIGLTICKVLKVEGTTLHVEGLDAIDSTPVLDLKPWMIGFAPRENAREPQWAKELLSGYW